MNVKIRSFSRSNKGKSRRGPQRFRSWNGVNNKEKRRIIRKACREFDLIQTEWQRVLARLHKIREWLDSPSATNLLPLSDQFAAIERAAVRAKESAYGFYMWAGREEIRRQRKARHSDE